MQTSITLEQLWEQKHCESEVTKCCFTTSWQLNGISTVPKKEEHEDI